MEHIIEEYPDGEGGDNEETTSLTNFVTLEGHPVLTPGDVSIKERDVVQHKPFHRRANSQEAAQLA